MTLDCDSVLCVKWRPESAATTRREIDQQEKFISFFKVGIVQRMMNARDTPAIESTAGARAANVSVDNLSEVISDLDKKARPAHYFSGLLGRAILRDPPAYSHGAE
jgi:type IV secretion system protein VirB4